MLAPTRRFLDRTLRRTPVASFGFFRNDLASLLAAAGSAHTLGERIQWTEDLVAWIRLGAAPAPDAARPRGKGLIQAVRVRFFLQTLERRPEARADVARLLGSLLMETEAVSLLGETGLHNENGFFGEALERLVHRVLPAPRDERNLAELFSRVFSEEADADWLAGLDANTLQAFLSLLFSDGAQWRALEEKFLSAMADALIVLSAQVESLGLSSEIRLRSDVRSVSQSAFYRLRAEVADALEGRRNSSPATFAPLFARCREEIGSAFRHLEEHGVSVSIVFRLEKMERHLTRMEYLVAILFAPGGAGRPEAWTALLADLVRGKLANDSLRSLVERNLHMLSRKIVERTGQSGEHYITSSRTEYFTMLASAGGGGVLTAGTALLKTLIGHTHPALFFEGLFAWMNYSGSFLLMNVFHFTLATKQPSMTAPALAAKLNDGQGGLSGFADLVARITRSQFAAALGNIGATVPTAFAIDWLFTRSAGHHLFEPAYALRTAESLHPWESPTLAYAALTGVLLWISSIGSGWFENFFVYRRLPEATRQSPWLRTLIGARNAERFASWLSHNISGLAGSVVLGFLLSFVPIAGRFFGAPLDVRHVTLSTASLTFSFCAMPHVSWLDILLGALSIATIGVLNFGVSFAAALITALKARDVPWERIGRLRSALWVHFRREPLSFIFPKRRAATKGPSA